MRSRRACRPDRTVAPLWDNDRMIHDPLCYMTECPHPDPHGDFKATCGHCTAYCVCNLIAKVRADTLDKARQAVTDVPWGISYGKGLHINQSKALDAIDALRTT